jgi:predicted NBD/HSP70 family sugar kinase
VLTNSPLAAGANGRALRRTAKVLPGDARAHNRALILQALFGGGLHSRADLARLTGLTRVTASDLVTDLMEAGLVREVGPRSGGRVGKPATLVELDADAAHVVALDLSDEQAVSGAVVALDGTVRARRTLPRQGRTGTAARDLATRLASVLVAAATRPVLGVGVGSPGVVDPSGVVLDARNLGWRDLPLAEHLAGTLSLPVYVANDANTAALAEHSFGGTDGNGLLLVTVGEGVGAGLLLDGALVRGHRYAAGEIGHVVVDENGAPCVCGRTGCLETVLSVPNLRAALAAAGPPGSPEARDALTAAGVSLGVALAPVVSTLNLSEVVLNGPAALLGGPLLEATAETVRRRTLPGVGDALDLRLSALHQDGVVLGAAVLVLSGQLGVA